MSKERRNSGARREPELDQVAQLAPQVGGRQGGSPCRLSGGGSPPSCTSSGGAVTAPAPRGAAADEDPRIDELRRMGLGRIWIELARAIGFEAFVAAWRVLSLSDAVGDDRNRVCVPAFSSYQRYQRNLLIRSLNSEGLDPAQIRGELGRMGCEQPSELHIKRILKRA